jgi:predicted lipid-binding transport protein (Tim44 family)
MSEQDRTKTDDRVATEDRDATDDQRSSDDRLTTADLVKEADNVDEADDTDASVEREPLFAGEDAERFRGRWQEIQAAFVDEPREAVKNADSLVADLMQRLAATFSEERSSLESQWDSGEDASTEDLRVALQRYRSFFDRLLSA